MNTNRETAGPGKYVAYSYKLYDDADGSLLFETPADAPDMLIYGVSRDVVPGIIETLKGLAAGDRFSVTLPPEAAFGERYDENVVELDRSIFERDGQLAEEVKIGAELPMMTQEGFRILGRVFGIDNKHVKMDFNHPFAGKTVRYDGVVELVRDATPEELNPPKSCGCSHDHSDGCGDHCDDGCCSDHHNHEGSCGCCH